MIFALYHIYIKPNLLKNRDGSHGSWWIGYCWAQRWPGYLNEV